MSVEGSSYYLPQTALRFALQIEKSTYTPGEFAGYASRYLKRNDVSLSPSTTYRIVGLKLTSVAQPDTAKFFTAKADAKHSIRSLERDDNGVLVAVNAQPRKVELPKPFQPAPKPAPLNPHDYMTEEILSAGSCALRKSMTYVRTRGCLTRDRRTSCLRTANSCVSCCATSTRRRMR